jgi:ferredoxin
VTPFGIRRRLKSLIQSLIGGGSKGAEPPPRPKWPVTFELPDGTTFTTDAKEGDSLVLASGRGPQPIDTGCADGTCGTCQVDVLSGSDQLTAPDEQEAAAKTENKVPADRRLGCQTGILGPGVRVRVINVFGADGTSS